MKTCLDLHLYFRYLDENLDLELMLEWVKTLGASGIRWMYFAGKKNINLGGGQRVECYEINWVPQMNILKP